MTDPADEYMTTGLSLPRKVLERVQDEADKQRRSRSAQIALILIEYFERQDAPTTPKTNGKQK